MYVLEWRTASALTRGLFWCLFPELLRNSGNKNIKKNSSREYVIILLFTRHNESINDEKKNLNTSSPCLTRLSFYWWPHNRLPMTSQWPDNFNPITWIMKSNSFYIYLINGDIHGRSCKNVRCFMAGIKATVWNISDSSRGEKPSSVFWNLLAGIRLADRKWYFPWSLW